MDATHPQAETAEKTSGGVVAKVVSAVVVVGVIVILLWSGEIPFAAGITLITALGLAEFYGTYRKHDYLPNIYLGIPAGCAFPVIAYFLRSEPQNLSSFTLAIGAFIFLSFLVFLIAPGKERSATNIALTFTGAMLVGFCLSHFVLMLHVVEGETSTWIAPFTVIVLIWINDAVAYIGGSALGRHKLVPRISPGKSWEGAAAGTIATFAAGYALFALLDRSWLTLALAMQLSAIVCLVAPVGDLSESLLKRELGVKDMGSLIPGHGGILDRFDSMFFTAVICYYFLRLVRG
ncbi:MAG: phosphatidate cytidylyltransferase [Candidatus Geothermincolia bacterium]